MPNSGSCLDSCSPSVVCIMCKQNYTSIICFFILSCRAVIGLQLDRGNLGNAATDNLMKDIGITQNEYNNGST